MLDKYDLKVLIATRKRHIANMQANLEAYALTIEANKAAKEAEDGEADDVE